MKQPAKGPPRLSDQQRLQWLRLIRTDNVGPATFRDLINRYGSAETALEALPDLTIRGGAGRAVNIPDFDTIEAELGAIYKFDAKLVAIGEAEYPNMLVHMDQPPPLVTMKGAPQVFDLPAAAIVGSRNASAAGARMARNIATELGAAGYAVVSGLARGIDKAAHQAALATGTIGVLAGGIDKPYPPENEALYDEIPSRGGALVSEMPFGWEPRAKDFPRRNRLIAGLSLGLVVVEAAKRSGSLISARLAGEMGRLVFAVPGSPLDPRAFGTNKLIKDGAAMVTAASDVIDELAPLIGQSVPERDHFSEPPDFSNTPPPGDNERDLVLEALGPVPTHQDDIIRHTQLPPAQIFMVLLELDLAGRLGRHSGGAVSLVIGDS
ncbi:MAG: DNA-processing protein DprA [Rhizobiaceae bacterium]